MSIPGIPLRGLGHLQSPETSRTTRLSTGPPPAGRFIHRRTEIFPFKNHYKSRYHFIQNKMRVKLSSLRSTPLRPSPRRAASVRRCTSLLQERFENGLRNSMLAPILFRDVMVMDSGTGVHLEKRTAALAK
jgi:hypothetical protein